MSRTGKGVPQVLGVGSTAYVVSYTRAPSQWRIGVLTSTLVLLAKLVNLEEGKCFSFGLPRGSTVFYWSSQRKHLLLLVLLERVASSY